MRTPSLAVALTLLLSAGACRKRPSADAVAAAIQAHLNRNPGLSLNAFTTTIEEVKFQGDTANARVRFTSKQNPGLAVEVGYGLKRVGSHWEVVSSAPLGGQGDQHAPLDQSGTNLPAGHPDIGAPPPVPKASH